MKKLTYNDLNEDQKGLIDSLLEWYDDPTRQYFLLSGRAGTGKTTCIKFFIEKLKERHQYVNMALSAPTNKATAVIRESFVDLDAEVTTATIYSLLGLRLQANGAVKELADMGFNDFGMFDLVGVDEGSMLTKQVLNIMDSKIENTATKVLLIGDKFQIPPVGETMSPIWTYFPVDYELTKVERHDNAILEYVESIRNNPDPTFESPGEPVYMHDNDTFFNAIVELAEKGYFHSGKAKAIAWRNDTVEMLSKFIRSHYEQTNSKRRFVKGDRIVFTEPVPSPYPNTPPLAVTDEEATVIEANANLHPKYPQFKVWNLKIEMELTGKQITVNVVHESSIDDLEAYKKELAEKKQWKSYWTLSDSFSKVMYAYALTGHRSQGSTFEYVFVDAGDIQSNFEEDTRTKVYYVACGRASKELHIFP